MVVPSLKLPGLSSLQLNLEACTFISGSVYYVMGEARRRQSLPEVCFTSLSPPSQAPTGSYDTLILQMLQGYRGKKPTGPGEALPCTLVNEYGRWPPPRQLWAEGHLCARRPVSPVAQSLERRGSRATIVHPGGVCRLCKSDTNMSRG